MTDGPDTELQQRRYGVEIDVGEGVSTLRAVVMEGIHAVDYRVIRASTPVLAWNEWVEAVQPQGQIRVVWASRANELHKVDDLSASVPEDAIAAVLRTEAGKLTGRAADTMAVAARVTGVTEGARRTAYVGCASATELRPFFDAVMDRTDVEVTLPYFTISAPGIHLAIREHSVELIAVSRGGDPTESHLLAKFPGVESVIGREEDKERVGHYVERLVEEAAVPARSLRSRNDLGDYDRVIVHGAGASLPHLVDAFAARQVTAQFGALSGQAVGLALLARPPYNLRTNELPAAMAPATAAGATLEGLAVIPNPNAPLIIEQRRRRAARKGIIRAAAVALVAVVLCWTIPSVTAGSKLSGLRSQLSSETALEQRLTADTQEYAFIHSERTFRRQVLASEPDFTALLNEVEGFTPFGAGVITSVTFSPAGGQTRVVESVLASSVNDYIAWLKSMQSAKTVYDFWTNGESVAAGSVSAQFDYSIRTPTYKEAS